MGHDSLGSAELLRGWGPPNNGGDIRGRDGPDRQRHRPGPPPPSYGGNNGPPPVQQHPQAPRSGPVYLPSQERGPGPGGPPEGRSRGGSREPVPSTNRRQQQQHNNSYDHLWNSSPGSKPQQQQQSKIDRPPQHNDDRKESYMSHTESETSPESEIFSDHASREGSDAPE